MFKACPNLKLLSQTIFSDLVIDHREKVFNENLSDYIYMAYHERIIGPLSSVGEAETI